MGCGSSKIQAKGDNSTEKQRKEGIKAEHNSTAAADHVQFNKIDEHARKAPQSLKNSVQGLVNYMSSFSKEPKILARGFYVWIADNIRYDVDGYFGRSAKAPCDALSVIREGRSVCEGYANVMEELCRQANIPVQKISGYSKGFGYSADQPVSLSNSTDHAWNSIQLDGKWFLLDCTWGAGHIDSNSFKKEFDDFYFLTDPRYFIFDHFPYMNNNLKESQKWQLLPKPIGLQEFNNKVTCKPAAFKLGIQAVSHPDGYITMKNELRMRFKCTQNEVITLSARLMLNEGNMMTPQGNATFCFIENSICVLLVHPQKAGLYTLEVFGKYSSDERLNNIPQVFEYVINCTDVKEKDFEYPMTYDKAGSEKTILHEPLRGKLPQNTAITFKISAPYLQNIRVGETYLNKRENMFTGEVNTGTTGDQLSVWGTRGDQHSKVDGLYRFSIC